MGITRCYKTTVFLTFMFAVILLKWFYVCILLRKPIYGFVKANRRHIRIQFRFFCELNHQQHSYDVIKVVKMAAGSGLIVRMSSEGHYL